MRRLFAELPSPWRYVVFALVVVGLWFVLRWVDREDPKQVGASGGPAVAIHVKVPPAHGLAVPFGTLRPELPLHARRGDPLARWFVWELPADRATATLASLRAAGAEAYLEPVYTLPTLSVPVGADAARDGDSCPITTPTYDHHQEYLGPAPAGIAASSVWRTVQGQGVWFADIEGGWNAKHEDLPGARITHVVGRPIADPSWRAHGTAVLGEVVGQDNGKGVIGIAPEVERVFTASIGGTTVADALDEAAARLRAGDVLLIELQGTGPRGRYVPVEYWDDNFEVIRAAVDRGIVVIEAAGNGNENLDHTVYKHKFDPRTRDSGAILVGAGGPPRPGFTDRARLDFSNYGARVDVQGWGRKVTTLEYGDLQRCKGSDRAYTDRHYTGEFSGTSSASPIVAGAAVLIESFARAKLGHVVTPEELRAVLRATGSPQTGNVREHIGPRPDLVQALDALVAD